MLLKNRLFFTCYDDEGGPTGSTGPTGTEGDPTVTNQAELNAVLKREKEKFRTERQKLITQLEEHKKNAQLTGEQKEMLETQIEELRTANLSSEERARHNQARIQKEYDEKLTAATESSKQWQDRYRNQHIGYDIKSAAAEMEVIPGSIPLVEAFLRPKARLVEGLDTEGKGTGHYTAKVQFDDVDAKGNPVVLDLTVNDAIKRMKELPEKFGNLFKGTASGGVGGTTGNQGKKPDVSKMTTAEYLEARKKDPASVGLK